MQWRREGRSPRQSHCSKQAVLIGWVLVSPASASGRLYQLRLPWEDMDFAWQQTFMTITKPASVETVSGYGTLWHRHHETAYQMRPCQPLAAAPTCSYTNCTYPAHTHGLDAHSVCVVYLLHIHTKTHATFRKLGQSLEQKPDFSIDQPLPVDKSMHASSQVCVIRAPSRHDVCQLR